MYRGIGRVRRRGDILRAGLRSSRFSCSFSRSLFWRANMLELHSNRQFLKKQSVWVDVFVPFSLLASFSRLFIITATITAAAPIGR